MGGRRKGSGSVSYVIIKELGQTASKDGYFHSVEAVPSHTETETTEARRCRDAPLVDVSYPKKFKKILKTILGTKFVVEAAAEDVVFT